MDLICCSTCAKDKIRTEFLKSEKLLKTCHDCRTKATQHKQRQRQLQKEQHPEKRPWRLSLLETVDTAESSFSVFRQTPEKSAFDPQQNQASKPNPVPALDRLQPKDKDTPDEKSQQPLTINPDIFSGKDVADASHNSPTWVYLFHFFDGNGSSLSRSCSTL